ncbi:hypothetical protein Tco_0918213, partial [Tanacetum coccineum]
MVDFLADSHIRYALTANPTIYASLIEHFWQTTTVKTDNNEEQQLFKTKTRTRRMGIRIPQSDVPSSVADEVIIKEMHDGLVRATTTASSLEAEQGSGNIAKTQTKATS